MPEGVEYLHYVQAALDKEGLRYQVLDVNGVVRERLGWPFALADAVQWQELLPGETDALFSGRLKDGRIAELKLKGRIANVEVTTAQTIFSAFSPGSIEAIWLGVRGPKQTLAVIVHRKPGRSPSYWLGPDLAANENFDIQSPFPPTWVPAVFSIATTTIPSGHFRAGSCDRVGTVGLAAAVERRSRTKRYERLSVPRRIAECCNFHALGMAAPVRLCPFKRPRSLVARRRDGLLGA
jgi:hypothetical protein